MMGLANATISAPCICFIHSFSVVIHAQCVTIGYNRYAEPFADNRPYEGVPPASGASIAQSGQR